MFLTQAFAEEALTHHKKDLLIDGFYPPYPEIKPTQDKVTDALIERGEYLAKMGDCIACHTNVKEGTAPYAGGLPLATPFGTFYSPNITPDKETGIGKWTEEDFIRALKKGRDPKGHNYFPVFPYIYFSKITDEDAKALYTYFMHIPPVKQKNKSLPFPFNMPGARFSLWGWNILFFFPHAKQFKYNPEQNNEWNRGRYIVEGLGHCGMCHTPLTIFGSPKRRYYLTGSFVDGYWAPNITKYGLISATHQDVADVFSTHELINEAGPVVGPMAEVNHNSLQHMTPEDRLAIATFLKTVISTEPLAFSPSEAKPSIQRGKAVYYKVCEICHQEGKMSAPRNGDSANWYLRLKSSGLSGLYRHTINGYNSMPVKGACVTCSDNDLISAVDYLLNNSLTRSQWDNLKKGGKRAFPSTGKEVYFDSCALCHNSGKEGAPRIGDKEKWDALVKQNVDVLFANTMHSRVHPQNGGCAECSSDEILEAIKYILSQSTTTGNYSLW
ncbi:MAG: cytochrome C [Legionellales bacterium RIFCSPHIGHO2_12_FULL_37_14]|nr:MAG: cytochrome C [Legionellales bacterium RIFCSPHIGHO2_12_FULL_37_14]